MKQFNAGRYSSARRPYVRTLTTFSGKASTDVPFLLPHIFDRNTGFDTGSKFANSLTFHRNLTTLDRTEVYMKLDRCHAELFEWSRFRPTDSIDMLSCCTIWLWPQQGGRWEGVNWAESSISPNFHGRWLDPSQTQKTLLYFSAATAWLFATSE
jgi:hypothetical protein